jgi:MFS family permease
VAVPAARIGALPGLTEANRRWWTLAGTNMGLFVLMLDSTVINVALPDIARELDATTAGLQWVMNAYLLVLAAFVVSAGRLGDIFGRRRLFVLGMAAFAGGSVVAAMSDGEEVLVAGRILQGLGAAALMGLSLAIVSTVFPAGERARALGIWAGVSALALGLGPLVGGALVEAVSWRWLFWLNLPFCLLGVALVLAWTAEQRDETATRRIDVAGVTTVALGLAAIVIALVEGKVWGWTSVATVGVFAAGVGLLVAFCSSSITSGGRSSSSTCSATGPTSELAPPDSAWSAVTGP